MKNKIKKIAAVVLLLLFSATAAIVLPCGNKMISQSDSASVKHISNDITTFISNIDNNINAEIFDLPPVYILPVDSSPAQQPNPANFTENTYTDDTISVKCWKERIELSDKTVTANFAEITISHPSQLRTSLAGRLYGTGKRICASTIAEAQNAVIAINGDYYSCRHGGIIVRHGNTFRQTPLGIDALFIDSDGNFSVMNDKKAISNGYLQQNDIDHVLEFGPVLVNDGKAITDYNEYNCVDCGISSNNPRTAIGQLGPLHYLICTIDGRTKISPGVKMHELANIMADKNCTVAYNLDGGQSTAMIFNNKLYNVVSNGGERSMSDIIYFGTAIPESEWE